MSSEGRPWYSYVDQDANIDQIERLTSEFLAIFDKCPSRLKKKILQSHNDTKDQEERRKRENMQSDQYRIDFGNGDVANVSMNTQHALQGGNPLQGGGSGSGSSGLGSGSGPNSGGQSSSQGHPPPAKQPKYPPGHAPPSRSKPPGPGHGHPPSSKPPHNLHGKSSSVPGHPPGYRPGGSSSKHNTSLGDKPGQRPEAGHHQRSQSHGGQPLTDEQLKQQQREQRHREQREQQYKQHQQQKLQQQQQQQHGAMPGYPPGYGGRSSSNSSLPPPYPGAGQQMPNKHPSSSSASQHQSKSMPRSIFDLSPEKTARPEKPPPALGPITDPPMPFHESLLPAAPPYPQPGQHPSAPPSYSAPGPMPSFTLPPYPKPGEPPFQPPQSISPIRDNPSLSLNTRHQPPIDPSSMIDTPTPTHIANMFSYPGGSKQPGSNYPMSNQAQMQSKSQQQRHDRSMQNIMGDFSHSQQSSDTKPKTSTMHHLFDDFDDLPLPQGLPQAPTLPSKVPSMSSQKQSKQHPVSDFAALFGDEGDSSSLFGNLSQNDPAPNLSFGGFSGSGHKPEHPSVKTEIKTEAPSLSSHSSGQSMSASVKTEYTEYKVKKEETDSKRRSSDKLQSEEKKPRLSKTGGLFSPSPSDEKPNLPSLISPLKSEQDHKRSRTASSSKDPDAVVSVQKLENLAPEFQAFRGSNAPASIILGPNDRPSPSKKKEGDPSPKKERQESSQDKRRSGSGPSREKPPEAGASNSSPSKSEDKNRDHKKKKEKREKKDKKEKKDKRKEGEPKKEDDKVRIKFFFSVVDIN